MTSLKISKYFTQSKMATYKKTVLSLKYTCHIFTAEEIKQQAFIWCVSIMNDILLWKKLSLQSFKNTCLFGSDFRLKETSRLR